MQGICHGNRTNYGMAVGILMNETQFPRIPGDVGNANTFPYPVLYRIIPGANADSVVLNPDFSLVDLFVQKGLEMEREGVKAIVTSCGFNAIFHKEIASKLHVPFLSSSLLQVRMVSSMVGGRKIGIITVNREALTDRHFQGVGVEQTNQVVYGIEHTQFGKALLENRREIDVDLAERELAGVVETMVRENPDLAAVVLECTNLPPFSQVVRERSGLPVFDMVGLIDYVYRSIRPRSYDGDL